MSAIKFFVNQEGIAAVECPQCKKSRSVSVAAYKGKKFTQKVKCPCGHIFTINLDFREHFRKQTLLEGNYRKTNLSIKSLYKKLPNKNVNPHDHPDGAMKICTVKDLSLSGIGLDIWGQHTIEKGNELLIEFHLDDRHNSFIRCEVTVKTVRKNWVGAEFKDKSDVNRNRDLGFYLFS